MTDATPEMLPTFSREALAVLLKKSKTAQKTFAEGCGASQTWVHRLLNETGPLDPNDKRVQLAISEFGILQQRQAYELMLRKNLTE